MSEWVPQSECSSITTASRARTAYLAPLVSVTVVAVEEYFRDHPDGEEVTLVVLQSIGLKRIRAVSKGRSLARAKQDVGLFVAQTLVDLYGAIRVHTLRRDDRKGTSARRNTRGGLDWVNSYAPHRVLPYSSPIARILLDTSIVRNVVHNDPDALDIEALRLAKGGHLVSIADGALAELAAQLLRGSVPLDIWTDRVAALDSILDDDFPVAPGGMELASFWGAHSPVGLDLGEARAYYRAAWSYLRRVKQADDLTRREVFLAPSGRTYAIRLDPQHVNSVLADTGRKWSEWVSTIAALISDLRRGGDRLTEADLRQLTLTNLAMDMSVADASKLDLVIHILAKRALQASSGQTPYRPKGESNDPLDLDLLFGIPLPAWVVTADMRLHRLVRLTDSQDKNCVMTPAEVVDRLRKEVASAGEG